MTRTGRCIAVALALSILPTLAPAEISVQTDHQGHFRRLVVLTRGSGPSRVVWGQVRRAVPLNNMLNPLGDNLGDLPPKIVSNPLTGAPWAFWSMNIANQKRMGFSFWNGTGWTPPAPVVAAPGPYYYDELDPSVGFVLGTPYLVWSRAEPTAKVYLSILVAGVWTPPVLLSDPLTDSRKPTITIDGAKSTTKAIVTCQTPFGPWIGTYDTAALFEAAASLMDTPIPPGHSVPPPTSDGKSGGGRSVPGNRQ